MREPSLLFMLLAVVALAAGPRSARAQDPPAQPPAEQPSDKPVAPAASDLPATIDGVRELLNAGYYDRAEEAFQKLADDEKTRLPAALGLAQCRIARGKYTEALEDLVKLNAGGVASWRILAAEACGWVGQYDKKIEHLRAAIEIDPKAPRPRYLLARTLEYLGRRDEAIEEYRWFEKPVTAQKDLPRDAEWITYVALGFLRYSVLTETEVVERTKHVLLEMLQTAYQLVDRTYWPARIAAADLLREKYNNKEEDGSVSDYTAALRINSNLPEAHVGLGEIALDGWAFEEVERRAGLALDTNPHYPPALHLLARKFIAERRYAQAGEQADKALAVNDNDLVALALKAAAAACRYDDAGVAAAAARFTTIAPRSPRLSQEIGIALGGIRQYAASEKELLKAIELDATNANTRTDLGMMYMQWGLEDKARDALDAAWKLDRFNERTQFTLELLDKLQHFARHESAHFIVRFDNEKDPGLGAFLAGYLEGIHAELTRDYETPLAEKTVIEVFPTHKAFGVRITGKPWIHTVGACTGRVIALDSPRRSADLEYGPYNIANVLRHEFTHTVTLAATHNRIPHWFTEGLAVYQEDSPRSFVWSRMLADACRRDELFTLESIDWAFMRPQRPNDRQQAYAQSEWQCEFIVDRFGYDVINAMLRQYREGRTQPQVIRDMLKVEPEVFDREFKEWACAQAATWGFDMMPPESPMKLRAAALLAGEDAALQGKLARAEFDAGNIAKALEAARRALKLDESQKDGLEVFALAIESYIQQEASEAGRRQYVNELVPVLRRLAEVDGKNWTAPRLLAAIALQREEFDEAVEQFRRLQRLCPMDPVSWRGLAGIYLQRKEYDLALEQLLNLARTEEHDPEVPAEIGRIFKRKGKLAEARHWMQQALYIDPFGVPLHEQLAEVCMLSGDTAAALREYTMLAHLQPDEARHHERAALAAHKLGDAEAAAKFARRAVELDANSSAKTLLPAGP